MGNRTCCWRSSVRGAYLYPTESADKSGQVPTIHHGGDGARDRAGLPSRCASVCRKSPHRRCYQKATRRLETIHTESGRTPGCQAHCVRGQAAYHGRRTCGHHNAAACARGYPGASSPRVIHTDREPSVTCLTVLSPFGWFMTLTGSLECSVHRRLSAHGASSIGSRRLRRPVSRRRSRLPIATM